MKTPLKTSPAPRLPNSQTLFRTVGRRQPMVKLEAVTGEIKCSHGKRSQSEFGNEGKLLLFVVVMAISSTLFQESARAANAENDYKSTASGTGNITDPNNWIQGRVLVVTDDAVFNSDSAAGIKNYGGGVTVGMPVTVGSVDVTATNGTYSIRNDTTGSSNAILTLGGVGNLGNSVSGTAADLLYVAYSGGTLRLLGDNGSKNGTGVLNVILGQSGNFNSVGTIVISSIISDGGSNFAVTKTGLGTLTLSGANTYGGGTTLVAGTLNINNGGTSTTNSALGTGRFVINGGSISNTGVAAVTVATNNAQTWNGDFTFAGGSSTNSLNLGAGAVTLVGNRQINVAGKTKN